MSKEQLEIDFLATEKGSGDAIVLRYGDFDNEYKVVVIDAGYKTTGEKLVKLIKQYYGENTIVDLMICTHSDQDHASGLTTVMEAFKVKKIWINLPWDYTDDLIDNVNDGRITTNGLESSLKSKYPYVDKIHQKAIQDKIPMYPLIRGSVFDNGVIKILSPTREYHRDLLKQSSKTPIDESLTKEKDSDDSVLGGVISAENSMSGVTLLEIYGRKYLFTADTGVEALSKVIDYCKGQKIELTDLTWMQVPHHGSRHNIDKNILEKIKAKVAYVSAAKDAEKHPAKAVLSAFNDAGITVYSTEGNNLRHSFNGSYRPNYSKANPRLPNK